MDMTTQHGHQETLVTLLLSVPKFLLEQVTIATVLICQSLAHMVHTPKLLTVELTKKD